MYCEGEVTDDPAIRLVRPLYTEYIIVGKVVRSLAHDLYKTSENSFVDECMKASGGSMNPNRLREIYRELMEEAGL